MSVRGRWRIFEISDEGADPADLLVPAYILFDGKGGGEFAFGSVCGAIRGAGDSDAGVFTWRGDAYDERDELVAVTGDGTALLQSDGSLTGSIRLEGGGEHRFSARAWPGS